MKTFTLCGTTYNSVPFDFNMICALEAAGLSLNEVKGKPMLMMRTYVAKCADVSYDEAGLLINKHVVNGGKFDKILECLSDEMAESDFFRALAEKNEQDGEKTATATSKKTAK